MIHGVLNAIPYGLLVLDANLTVTAVNQPFLDLTQQQRQAIIGQSRKIPTTTYIDALWHNTDQMKSRILAVYDQQNVTEKLEGQLVNQLDCWLEWQTQPILTGEYEGGWLELFIDVSARKQLQIEHEQAQQTLVRLSSPLPASKTAESFGLRSFRQSAPAIFAKLVTTYERLLEKSIEKQVYKITPPTDISLSDLAEQLGRLQAKPRDVVELHMIALQNQQKVNTMPQQLYVDEGRLLLLELMGLLASYYQNHAMGLANKNK